MFAGCGGNRDTVCCASELRQQKRGKKLLVPVFLKDVCVDVILEKPS